MLHLAPQLEPGSPESKAQPQTRTEHISHAPLCIAEPPMFHLPSFSHLLLPLSLLPSLLPFLSSPLLIAWVGVWPLLKLHVHRFAVNMVATGLPPRCDTRVTPVTPVVHSPGPGSSGISQTGEGPDCFYMPTGPRPQPPSRSSRGGQVCGQGRRHLLPGARSPFC